ncbi:MAG: fibrobacter succinogenes major paralogous domain-containing protein [Bacteroidales bacterium]|nr:fibrobacter succinogenes major paralogous domain-containing protein [Bacteroidales bacterium]
MKTRLVYMFNIILVIFTITIGFNSCEKEEKTELPSSGYEVTFAIDVQNLKSTFTVKNALDCYNLDEADKVILTIQNSDGSSTKYTSSELKIQIMNGYYYTQKVVLKTGDYKLTEFLILNASGSTIFASPIAGSQEAQNVAHPIPISFSVIKNVTTPVSVEVLSTKDKKPEDFGLTQFPIIEVKTFSFLIGVADYESDQLLSAKLTVSNGSYSYVQNLNNIANNVITIKDNISNYTVTVEKPGYDTFTYTFLIDSLKYYSNTMGNLPLFIEIQKLITDMDGNVYHSLRIGSQVWMVENLKTTKYNDGTDIPLVTDSADWTNLAIPGYCWNNNDEYTFKNPYGALYNWYTVETDKLCPIGWHVPNITDWTELVIYLENNGYNYDGTIDTDYEWNTNNRIAKSLASKTGWNPSSEIGAVGNIDYPEYRNKSGFNAFPSGARSFRGYFFPIGKTCDWWSATEKFDSSGQCHSLASDYRALSKASTLKRAGLSIRCVKD